MDFTGIDDLWNLHDAFTVQQAAALVAGVDPNNVAYQNGSQDKAGWFLNEHGLTDDDGINRVTTALAALVNAINDRTLAATIRRSAWERGWNEELTELESDEDFSRQVTLVDDDGWPQAEALRVKGRGVVFKAAPDWSLTTVAQPVLVKWLHSRGMRSGFFFPDAKPDAPEYLNSDHARYAPKLAAAVNAWLAVTDPGKKSPKQALDKWLRENAASFGLADDDGNPVNQAIEDCSKVANWQITGGAPKTPG